MCARLRMFVGLAAYAAIVPAASAGEDPQQVLVLGDEDPDSSFDNAPMVMGALTDAGYEVVSGGMEFEYAGLPDPSIACAVVHLNGESWYLAMPVEGQQALSDYVENGGGYVGMEWNAAEEENGSTVHMPDLILFQREDFPELSGTYVITDAGEDHPVTAGLPASFSFHSAFNQGSCKAGLGIDVLATEGANDSVCVREFGDGRVVGFSHAGSYRSGLSDIAWDEPANLQLVVQAVDWLCEPRPECGNEVVEEDEECDDGNTDDGDGCAADCSLEGGTTGAVGPTTGAPASSSGADDSSGTTTGMGEAETGIAPSTSGTTSAGSSTTGAPVAASGSDAETGLPDPGVDAAAPGCGCRSGRGDPAALLLLGLVFGLRPRRRRS